MKGGIAKTSFSALFPLFESCRFFCCCKFLEILRSSSASSLSFFFRHCYSWSKPLLLYLKIGKSQVMEKAGHEMGTMLQFPHE